MISGAMPDKQETNSFMTWGAIAGIKDTGPCGQSKPCEWLHNADTLPAVCTPTYHSCVYLPVLRAYVPWHATSVSGSVNTEPRYLDLTSRGQAQKSSRFNTRHNILNVGIMGDQA